MLGYVWNRPADDLAQDAPNKEELRTEIKISLAGYVAEKICIGTTSTGVGGGPGTDFYKAMRLASLMVHSYGMGKSGLVGDFSALKQRAGNAGGESLISEKTKETLDHDVQDILQECLKETTELLTQHKELLLHFAGELVKKGDLEYDEIVSIFNKAGLKPYRKKSAEDNPPV